MTEMKHKRAGWPKCNEVHSPENRIGQAWKAAFVQVFAADFNGEYRLFDMPRGSFLCPTCKARVEIDARGYAACETCGFIFNESPDKNTMSNRERKRRLEKFKWSCNHAKI